MQLDQTTQETSTAELIFSTPPARINLAGGDEYTAAASVVGFLHIPNNAVAVFGFDVARHTLTSARTCNGFSSGRHITPTLSESELLRCAASETKLLWETSFVNSQPCVNLAQQQPPWSLQVSATAQSVETTDTLWMDQRRAPGSWEEMPSPTSRAAP